MAPHHASCFCGAVRYRAEADPVDAKICHCRTCRILHGAPMQWAAIFHKSDIVFTAGTEHLRHYNSDSRVWQRILPCKVSCAACGTLLADEGRNMWLAFPTLFDFGSPPRIPAAFRPSCHIFYGTRVMDVDDGVPKWEGHKERSRRIG